MFFDYDFIENQIAFLTNFLRKKPKNYYDHDWIHSRSLKSFVKSATRTVANATRLSSSENSTARIHRLHLLPFWVYWQFSPLLGLFRDRI